MIDQVVNDSMKCFFQLLPRCSEVRPQVLVIVYAAMPVVFIVVGLFAGAGKPSVMEVWIIHDRWF